MFKWFLLTGWVLLLAAIIFIVLFPNVPWVPKMVWISGLVLVPLTLGYALFVAARVVLKRVKGHARPPMTDESPPRYSGTKARHKWIFGVGAATVLILSVLTLVERGMRSSTVYELSVEKVAVSPGVIGVLGKPIHEGWFVFGQITVSSNGSGRATLAIPLQGPKGKGKLNVEATRQSGRWQFMVLRFVANDRDFAIDLLREEPGGNRDGVE